MMHLVIGGSGSGKSAYAEELVLQSGSMRRYYIATMIPYGKEGAERVQRHQTMRQNKGFCTIECYTSLKNLVLPEKHSAVLLECLSNLVANELFEATGSREHTVPAVLEGIRSLAAQCDTLVVVTADVFADGEEYDAGTAQYMRLLGETNQRVAALADAVTEVVFGIPLARKGGTDEATVR